MECLTESELLSLLRTARAARERDWLLFLVQYNHGLRISEVLAITSRNVRNGFLSVKRLKGSKSTIHPLVVHSNPLLNERDALNDFIDRVSPGERIFPITSRHAGRLFHRYAEAAGIAYHIAHPHILKRSIALHSIKIAGIENVRQYLGHKTISSTGEYLKVSDADASTAVQRAIR
jgi:integrase